jgi:hypothetical protein
MSTGLSTKWAFRSAIPVGQLLSIMYESILLGVIRDSDQFLCSFARDIILKNLQLKSLFKIAKNRK